MVDEIGMVYGGGSHIDGIWDMNGIIYIYICMNAIPVVLVPHKAVAEVSKIGNL
jgi:hypothetical protein